MARSRETKIELTAYDDLFQTDESRAEAKLSKIRDIPLSQIDEFPDHPFKVLMDEDMQQLVESIKRNGVMTPATVRLKEDGRYELVSGHRRKKACELAGLETLKCEVKELTRDEAIIVMVESNLQTGFVLSEEEIAVTVSKVDEVVEIELVNYFIKGNIELTKVDADYPDNKLTGAVFEVYADTNGNGEFDEGDELCGEMTELEGGIYQMTELRYGKYFVREKTAPDGFVLDEGVYGVSIEENGKTYTVENKAGVGFINEAQKGALKIVKTSSDGKVEGFSFRVTSADGYDQTFKTDKNGEIFIEGLRIGEYTVSDIFPHSR